MASDMYKVTLTEQLLLPIGIEERTSVKVVRRLRFDQQHLGCWAGFPTTAPVVSMAATIICFATSSRVGMNQTAFQSSVRTHRRRVYDTGELFGKSSGWMLTARASDTSR